MRRPVKSRDIRNDNGTGWSSFLNFIPRQAYKGATFDVIFDMNRHSIPSPTLSRTFTAVNARGRVKYVFGCIQARIAVAIISPILFLTALAMLTVGIIAAKALVGNLRKLQRLAVLFQIVNYSLVMFISILGLVACIRRSLRISRLFTGLLIGQLPFGIVAGALAMRMIFKGIDDAFASPDAPFDTSCATSLESLSFICNDIKAIKPAVVLAYLKFWFGEIIAIYVAIVYTKQLSSTRDIKVLEEEDA